MAVGTNLGVWTGCRGTDPDADVRERRQAVAGYVIDQDLSRVARGTLQVNLTNEGMRIARTLVLALAASPDCGHPKSSEGP